MMNELYSIRRQIENSEDALHCLQAAFAMAVEAVSGEILSNEEAERCTGFAKGVETWPYRMIHWFASHGYDVKHIDALDALNFAHDPVAELKRSGFSEELIEYFDKISDYQAESAAILQASALGAQFETRLPSKEDVFDSLEDGWLPICALDAGALTQEYRTGYQGHMVLITGSDRNEETVRVQDSGPPPHWDWDVPAHRVVTAMRTPVESSGTITLVRLSEPGGVK